MLKSKKFKNIKPVIAIDGTAGSGKGTLAKNLSIKLNFDHLDTGILYRICAYEIKIKQKEMSKVNIMADRGLNMRLHMIKNHHYYPEQM